MRKIRRFIPTLLAAAMGISGAAVNTSVSEAAGVSQIENSLEKEEAQDPSKTDPVMLYGTTEQSLPRMASAADEYTIFSDPYKTTQFYTDLLSVQKATEGSSIMQRVLDISFTQEGYKNYAVLGDDPKELREQGLLWTGLVQRNTSAGTGNTEYTRWAEEYVQFGMGNPCRDCDWCAIFASWCMFQAGYYTETGKQHWYYSYCADPREEKSEGYWFTSFNFDQNKVWYTPNADYKVEEYSAWCNAVNTDIDPYDIPWKPGGLVFFNWNGNYTKFHHVAIVISYDPVNHVLKYMNGNSDGQVRASTLYLDKFFKVGYDGQDLYGKDVLMAYAEYDYTDPATVGKWHKNAKGWWYGSSTGWYPTDQWMNIDGYWYHFNKAGYMDHDCYIDGYYIPSSGRRSDTQYAWKHNKKGWWYQDAKGNYLADTWAKIDGKWYYFKEDGFMAASEWQKGYWLSKSGAWTYKATGSWHKNSKGWWFDDTFGWKPCSETVKIDGTEYEFNEDGYWVDGAEKDPAVLPGNPDIQEDDDPLGGEGVASAG